MDWACFHAGSLATPSSTMGESAQRHSKELGGGAFSGSGMGCGGLASAKRERKPSVSVTPTSVARMAMPRASGRWVMGGSPTGESNSRNPLMLAQEVMTSYGFRRWAALTFRTHSLASSLLGGRERGVERSKQRHRPFSAFLPLPAGRGLGGGSAWRVSDGTEFCLSHPHTGSEAGQWVQPLRTAWVIRQKLLLRDDRDLAVICAARSDHDLGATVAVGIHRADTQSRVAGPENHAGRKDRAVPRCQCCAADDPQVSRANPRTSDDVGITIALHIADREVDAGGHRGIIHVEVAEQFLGGYAGT